jgi:hypothetical protein
MGDYFEVADQHVEEIERIMYVLLRYRVNACVSTALMTNQITFMNNLISPLNNAVKVVPERRGVGDMIGGLQSPCQTADSHQLKRLFNLSPALKCSSVESLLKGDPELIGRPNSLACSRRSP